MTYIWINPVTDRMYDSEGLNRFLTAHGFCRVYCREDWGSVVREKYQKLAAESRDTVADVRCPAVERLLKEMKKHPGLTVPGIEPILIHCAREISGREELLGCPKIITTPCHALAEAGNQLQLLETEFLPWNHFLKRLGAKFPGELLKDSPIPPGFFGKPQETDVVTGVKEVESYLKEKRWNKVKMVELLYCRGGCHVGDGVTGL